ncbi:MAG: hypothetical protein EYC70_12435 [Planctomycetota bacterium]|nr:MAG: hypothetical protein EYC70_12435 [Planctomycetota bacterium]
MRAFDRRKLLKGLGAGAAAVLLRPRGLRAAARGVPRAEDLAALAERLRKAARAQALEVATDAIRQGADYRTLLGAVFLAGVHDVRPRHVGGKLHCVMVVESMFELAEGAPAEDAWLLALWNLDDCKRSQALDEREDGDWVLPPAPEVSFASAEAARAELIAAMEAWDDERADRALVGLLPHSDLHSAYALLWPYAARSFVNIGHKIIYAAQVERVLRRIGWHYADEPLRSLVYALLYQPGGRETRVWEQSGERAAKLPEGWLQGQEAPQRSLELLRALRDSDAAHAQDAVVAAFADGLGPRTVWDGLRLRASELFLQRARSQPAHSAQALLPVHAVTTTEAFGHAFATTASEATRRLLILQAAGWLADLRDALAQRSCLQSELPRLDALELSEDAHAGGGLAPLRSGLSRLGEEHHQHKYAAAMAIERRRVHPQWAAHIQAPALPYLPTGAGDSELAARCRAALRKAGVA